MAQGTQPADDPFDTSAELLVGTDHLAEGLTANPPSGEASLEFLIGLAGKLAQQDQVEHQRQVLAALAEAARGQASAALPMDAQQTPLYTVDPDPAVDPDSIETAPGPEIKPDPNFIIAAQADQSDALADDLAQLQAMMTNLTAIADDVTDTGVMSLGVIDDTPDSSMMDSSFEQSSFDASAESSADPVMDDGLGSMSEG